MTGVYSGRVMQPRRLSALFDGVQVLEIVGDKDVLIGGVEFQSHLIQPGFLFIAKRGRFPTSYENGHKHIVEAITRSCSAVVCEKIPEDTDSSVTYVAVPNGLEALIIILKNFYDNPSSKLKVIGITGTNGKTSTATLSYWIFRQLGFKTGLISTICIRINEEQYENFYTTPGVVEVNKIMADMVAAGCEYCFMETSSHGLDQERVGGIIMSGGVFTNLSHDHLDYHKTFSAYLQAKKKLFDSLSSTAFALVNADDPYTASLTKDTQAKIHYYSLKTEKDFTARVLKSCQDGLELEIDGSKGKFNLVGNFNAYNILAAYGIACCLSQDKMTILDILSRAPTIKGRFQLVPNSRGILVAIDFAHTPDAVEEVLKTANSFKRGNSILVCVVGCGGDRDVEKRPAMAKIAAEACDRVIITSDNPRFESPQAIIDDMTKGITSENRSKVTEIVDRRLAIKEACEMACSGDIVMIVGKGHEAYQIIGDTIIPFEDFEVAKTFLSM